MFKNFKCKMLYVAVFDYNKSEHWREDRMFIYDRHRYFPRMLLPPRPDLYTPESDEADYLVESSTELENSTADLESNISITHRKYDVNTNLNENSEDIVEGANLCKNCDVDITYKNLDMNNSRTDYDCDTNVKVEAVDSRRQPP